MKSEHQPHPPEVKLDELLPGPFGEEGGPGRLTWGRLEVGTTLAGRYLLGKCIGRGGMGQVFEAQDLSLEKRVAVKVLHPTYSGNRHYENLFRRESRTLATLQHGGIVPVHEFRSEGRISFLVMDFVEGMDLQQVTEAVRGLLKEVGRTAPQDQDNRFLRDVVGGSAAPGNVEILDGTSWFRSSARIVAEIARTLEAAHAKNIVHRDLTPRNVILRPGGSPVLLDFGLAGNLHSSGTVTESLLGTPGYLAPEQISEARIGAEAGTDIYQLGLLLYELLTLRPAYGGSHLPTILQRILRGDHTPPRAVNPAVPDRLEAIALKAMDPAPHHRYASARQFREDLERFLNGECPLAGGVPFLRRCYRSLRRSLRRRPLVSGLGVALGLVLAALLLGGWLAAPPPGAVPPPAHATVSALWRLPPEASATHSLSEGQAVHPEDLLGVVVETNRPAYVYTLITNGGPSPDEQYILPGEPERLDDLLRGTRRGGWQCPLPPGSTEVACSRAGGTLSEGTGLIVLIGFEPMPAIETWLDRLHAACERSEVTPGIPRRQAEGLYPSSTTDLARGEPLSALSPEELSRHLANFPRDLVVHEQDWPAERGERFEVWFPLR